MFWFLQESFLEVLVGSLSGAEASNLEFSLLIMITSSWSTEVFAKEGSWTMGSWFVHLWCTAWLRLWVLQRRLSVGVAWYNAKIALLLNNFFQKTFWRHAAFFLSSRRKKCLGMSSRVWCNSVVQVDWECPGWIPYSNVFSPSWFSLFVISSSCMKSIVIKDKAIFAV